MRIKEIKELIKLIEKSDVAEIEVSEGDYRVKINRLSATSLTASIGQPLATAVSTVPQVQPAGSDSTESKEAAAKSKEIIASGNNLIVKAPLVGTFYRSPSPDAKAYAEVGEQVSKGQVLCILEAMKLMNEIESEVDGTLRAVFPANGQSVEFGAPLFEIEPR